MDSASHDDPNEPAYPSNGDGRAENSQPPRGAPAPARRSRRLSTLVGEGLIIVIVGFAGVVLAIMFLMREDLPTLTAAELESAERRWREAGIDDYDLDVKVSGRQPSNYHVEVRGGEPVALTRNGVAPRRGMWDVWTVPGMFDTLHQELDQAEQPGGPFGSPPGTKVIERARFDRRYGYAARYHRAVLGTPLEVEWEIVQFRAVAPSAKPGREPAAR